MDSISTKTPSSISSGEISDEESDTMDEISGAKLVIIILIRILINTWRSSSLGTQTISRLNFELKLCQNM